MDIDSLAQKKIEEDADFQDSIQGLSEEDKTKAIATKKSEIVDQEFKTLQQKAADAEKHKELADNYKIRAEKAEKGSKKDDEGKKESDLSTKDVYALMNAEVPEEDIEEVQKAAKLLGKSVSEALQDSVVKGILAKKSEERVVANAANTGKARRTTQEVNDATLVANLSKGEVPEKGSNEAEKLFWARRKKK